MNSYEWLFFWHESLLLKIRKLFFFYLQDLECVSHVSGQPGVGFSPSFMMLQHILVKPLIYEEVCASCLCFMSCHDFRGESHRFHWKKPQQQSQHYQTTTTAPEIICTSCNFTSWTNCHPLFGRFFTMCQQQQAKAKNQYVSVWSWSRLYIPIWYFRRFRCG